MKEDITVSIIIPSFNYEKYITQTIESVIHQTYTNWELIIVDDGSKDNSLEIIKDFCQKDFRIKLYTHENNKNLGLKKTIELGISKVSTDWLVILESDDLINEDYLEKKVSIIKKYPSVNLVFNDCEFFGDSNKVKKVAQGLLPTQLKLRNYVYPRNMFFDFYLDNQIFTFSSIMVKKQDILKIDLNTPIDHLLDWWIYIQLANLGDFYYIPEKLTQWRQHPDSYLNKAKRIRTPEALQTKAYYKIYKQTHNFNILPFMVKQHILWYLRKFNSKVNRAKKILFCQK